MNIRNKTDVYNKIVRDLKEMPVISDIVLKKETDFNFESTILHKIRIFFNLRSGGDIMILKGELEKDDAEDHAEMWIEGRGTNGVPESIKDLLEDAEWIKNILLEVADKLNNLDEDEDLD